MGQVTKDYWSTDPAICTSVFPQVMNRNHFEAIMQAWQDIYAAAEGKKLEDRSVSFANQYGSE